MCGWAECGLCDVSAAGCGGLECHARSVECNQQVVTGLLCSIEAWAADGRAGSEETSILIL